jgi:hypothetical protein
LTQVRFLLALSGWAAVAAVAWPVSAQTPTEKVIVTAPKVVPDQALQDFIRSYTAPSLASEKVARWRAGICPITAGLPQAANRLITERVRQVAAMVGAPVDPAGSSKPNIDIVATFAPQLLLDWMRAKSPVLLGYHEAAQEKVLATVTHPVQAWYTTQTVDLNGDAYIDDKLHYHAGFYIFVSPLLPPVYVPEGNVAHVTGNHLGDGVSSELFHVVIVIDLAKINGLTYGALADYVSMLSLAQTQAFGTCQPAATITKLFSDPCSAAAKASEITDLDLAYLHGVYSIDPRSSFSQQQSDIAYQMKKGLVEK